MVCCYGPGALRIFFVFAAAALIYLVVDGKAGAGIVATIVQTAISADVLSRTRKKFGLQGMRGDRMLLDLRDRIRAQGELPELGEGWGSSLALKPTGGSSFGGDFVDSSVCPLANPTGLGSGSELRAVMLLSSVQYP